MQLSEYLRESVKEIKIKVVKINYTTRQSETGRIVEVTEEIQMVDQNG